MASTPDGRPAQLDTEDYGLPTIDDPDCDIVEEATIRR